MKDQPAPLAGIRTGAAITPRRLRPTLAAAALALAAIAVQGARTSAQPAAEGAPSSVSAAELPESLKDLEARPLGEIWDRVHALHESWAKKDSEDVLRVTRGAALFGFPDRTRLAAAALLFLARGEPELEDLALTALLQLAHGRGGRELQAAAVGLLARARATDRVRPVLERVLGEAGARGDAELEVEACLAIWRLDNTASRLPLLKLLESADFAARAAAAMALGQTGFFDARVVSVLRQLRHEPGRRGALAQLLYEASAASPGVGSSPRPAAAALEDEVARLRADVRRLSSTQEAQGRPPSGDTLVKVAELLRREYVDPERVHPRELAVEALKAMVSSLDHATFLSPAEIERRRARSLGQQLGLGAQLAKLGRDAPLVVVRPYHPQASVEASQAPGGATAPSARLLTGDRILSVSGLPTVGSSPEAILLHLAARGPGSKVYLEIKRWNEEASRTVAVEYGQVELPTLLSERYPGGLAYFKLLSFGPHTVADFRARLDDLQARDGALRGIVLDLRENPGGRLDQAVDLVDLFVGSGTLPIVSETRADGRSAQSYFASPRQEIAIPTVILVNRWTASAAEVVAGSLQDLGRAAVVGQRTYGKGVSQKRLPAPPGVDDLVGGPSQLQVPTHYLVLPSGRRFHTERDRLGRPLPQREGGITPDIEVEPVEEELEGWQMEELRRVQYSNEMDAYIRENYRVIKKAWDEGDLWDPAYYKEFDKLYDTLKARLSISLSKQQVRLALRSVLRHHLEDELGRELVSDPHEDRQLQAALRELLRLAAIDAASVPEILRWLPAVGEPK